jgi:hypothetical protein
MNYALFTAFHSICVTQYALNMRPTSYALAPHALRTPVPKTQVFAQDRKILISARTAQIRKMQIIARNAIDTQVEDRIVAV